MKRACTQAWARLSFSLLIAATALLPTAARAGHYDLVMSGGQVTQVQGGSTTTTPYQSGSNGWGGSSGAGGTLTASGEITATFQWKTDYPGEPPPQSVIVVERCKASAQGTGMPNTPNPTPYAKVDNGMGATPTNQSNHPDRIRLVAESTRYKFIPGANPLVMTCNPSAESKSVLTGDHVLVSYSVSVAVPQIKLSGVFDDYESAYVLTGQGISATLTGVSHPIVQSATSSATANPTWSFQTGGSACFGQFKITEIAAVPANPATMTAEVPEVYKAEVIPVDFDVSSLNFYTKATADVVVSCTATIKFPDNTTGVITAKSKKIQSKKPDGIWTITTGRVGFLQGNTVFGLTGVSGGAARGQHWAANITAPVPFASASGELAFLQLSNSNKDYTTNLSAPDDELTWPEPAQKGEGLDNAFPYVEYTFSLGAESNNGDSPNTTLDTAVTSVTLSSNYKTWLMFKPTGGQWVPIKMYTWNLTATATNNGGTWSKSVMTVPPPVPLASPTNDHPTWTKRRVNGPPVPKPKP